MSVPRDLVRAHFWLSLAIDAPSRGNDEYAETIRMYAAEARDAILSEMSPEQVAEAERLARDWTPRGG